MFRFTRKPSSGNQSQYLAKITHLVQSGYVELVQDVISFMAAYAAITLITSCFNNSTFFNVVCIRWKIKCWILLMHGVAMKTLNFIHLP